MKKKKNTKAVSLAEIAREAGVSRMAVSLALRNQPRVSKETRERVLSIAKKLGYKPDARLASWMTLVHDTARRELLPIAWINSSTEEDAWRRHRYLTPYFEGARNRCEQLGYRLEEFWLREPGMTNQRMSRILYSRGIQGVILAPPHDGLGMGHVRLDWQHFACAGFEEKVLSAPQIPRVAQDWFYNMTLALKLLRRSGYRRIGLLLPGQADRRSAHMTRAAAHYFHLHIPETERVPVLINRDPSAHGRDILRWIKKTRPDVVVGQNGELVDVIVEAGYRVPEDIGVVHLALEDDCADWAGVWACKREIGALTADMVVARLQKNDFGLPAVRSDTLIPGRWSPGRTLLEPKPGKRS